MLNLEGLSTALQDQSVSTLVWNASLVVLACIVLRVCHCLRTLCVRISNRNPQFLAVCVYRVTFHPFAKYPGPWLAKVSDAYGAYHNARGRLHTETEVAHRQYGKD